MAQIQVHPKMKLSDLNRIAREQGCRVRLIKIKQYADNAFTAIADGQFETALEHIRAASARIDEVMPCHA